MVNEAEPTEATVDAENVDATQAHVADRPPTKEEEAAAEESLKKFEGEAKEVAEHYEEMSDLGVQAKGEGKID